MALSCHLHSSRGNHIPLCNRILGSGSQVVQNHARDLSRKVLMCLTIHTIPSSPHYHLVHRLPLRRWVLRLNYEGTSLQSTLALSSTSLTRRNNPSSANAWRYCLTPALVQSSSVHTWVCRQKVTLQTSSNGFSAIPRSLGPSCGKNRSLRRVR